MINLKTFLTHLGGENDMKSYCIKDSLTGHVFKVLMTEEEFKEFLDKYNDMSECIDCVECDDAPSLCIE